MKNGLRIRKLIQHMPASLDISLKRCVFPSRMKEDTLPITDSGG